MKSNDAGGELTGNKVWTRVSRGFTVGIEGLKDLSGRKARTRDVKNR